MPQKRRRPSSRRRVEEKKEAEDVFVEKILDLTSWAKENTQLLVLAGIVLVVVAAGTYYYVGYRTSMRERAITQFEQIQNTLASGDRETAKAQLSQYIDAFGGTVYALEARLTLGQTLLEDGNTEDAIPVLAPAVRAMGEQPIGIQAAFLLASAYEQAGRKDDAEQLLLRIANTSDLTFQVREAYSGAARIREDQGDYAGAADLYRQILGTMDQSDPDRSYWEMLLAEAEASAHAVA
jgi:predicted negative regulator of RcsB-dependent stress response